MIKQIVFILIAFLSMSTNIWSQTKIIMTKQNGVYTIPCTVNGKGLRFIIDTGASCVCISQEIANTMAKQKLILPEDFVGIGRSELADGSIVTHECVNLKTVKIGPIILKNVKAIVTESQNAPLLLGQSVLDRLGKYSINKNILTIYKGRTKILTPSSKLRVEISDLYSIDRTDGKILEKTLELEEIDELQETDYTILLSHLYQVSNYGKLYQYSKKCISKYGESLPMLEYLSSAQLKIGHFKQGRETCMKKIQFYQKKSEKYYFARLDIATSYYDEEDYSRAITCLQSLLEDYLKDNDIPNPENNNVSFIDSILEFCYSWIGLSYGQLGYENRYNYYTRLSKRFDKYEIQGHF